MAADFVSRSLLARSVEKARRGWAAWVRFRAVATRFARYLKPQRGGLAVALAMTVLYVAARLIEPWPLKLIIDGVFLDAPPQWALAILPQAAATDKLWLLALLVLAVVVVAIAAGVFRYWQRIAAADAGLQLAHRLRVDLFAHVQTLSMRFHDRKRSGDLVVRMMSDIRILREAFIGMPIKFAEEVLLAVGMLVIMFLIDWQLTLVAMLLLPCLVLAVRRYHGPMKEAVKQQRERESVIASTAAEALAAIRIVQGFGREKSEIKRFGKANSRDLRSGLKAARLEGKLRWSVEISVGVVSAIIVGFATLRVRAGSLTPGDLIIFASYLATFYQPLRRLSRTAKRLSRATSAGQRVAEILHAEPDIADAAGAIEAPPFLEALRFESVSLRHGRSDWVLREIDLAIRKGERVAVVGPTGAGKSSLIGLIARFYDPSEGRVTLDGTDLRRLRLESLRRQLAIVFQEPVLFSASIAENIAYGAKRATRLEIEAAAAAAGIADVIEALPERYQTQVGERGERLSGGQRQCVAIARAIIANAPIVILDEPTTGLDPEASRLVTSALRALEDGRTVITVTHDRRTISRTDRIIVMAEGRIVADEAGARIDAAAGDASAEPRIAFAR